jgi:hypothetical protein
MRIRFITVNPLDERKITSSALVVALLGVIVTHFAGEGKKGEYGGMGVWEYGGVKRHYAHTLANRSADILSAF